MSRSPRTLTFNDSQASSMVEGPSFYGFSSGIFTVGYFVKNFSGKVYIEASLAKYPSEKDWFSLKINNKLYIEYANNTISEIFNLKCNAIRLRIRIDQTNITEGNKGSIMHAYVLI